MSYELVTDMCVQTWAINSSGSDEIKDRLIPKGGEQPFLLELSQAIVKGTILEDPPSEILISCSEKGLNLVLVLGVCVYAYTYCL